MRIGTKRGGGGGGGGRGDTAPQDESRKTLSSRSKILRKVHQHRTDAGARIAQLVVCWLAVLLDAASWVRSSSEENFSGRGDFPLGVNISDATTPKALSDETINRDLVCAQMRSIVRTQKILTFMY